MIRLPFITASLYSAIIVSSSSITIVELAAPSSRLSASTTIITYYLDFIQYDSLTFKPLVTLLYPFIDSSTTTTGSFRASFAVNWLFPTLLITSFRASFFSSALLLPPPLVGASLSLPRELGSPILSLAYCSSWWSSSFSLLKYR